MSIFLCSHCGCRAFALSQGLQTVECDACEAPLGSWQTFRATLRVQDDALDPEDVARGSKDEFEAPPSMPRGSLRAYHSSKEDQRWLSGAL